ncbi:MAG: hypothetical protein IKD66_00905 [Solobacterium sp.]|nr:hypothetical protein [Solobacterium sp.]
MTFTNNDLEMMMDQCIQELSKLGYPVGEIRNISFSPGSRTALAYCKAVQDRSRNPMEKEVLDYTFQIRVHGAFRDLDERYETDLRTLIMHEVIHTVDLSKLRSDKKRSGILNHGSDFLKVKEEIEQTYGYRHIYDDGGKYKTSLHKYMDEYYRKKAMKR